MRTQKPEACPSGDRNRVPRRNARENTALPGKVDPHDRVLVVDDCEADRFLTVRQLGKTWGSKSKLTVECAGDGTEALGKLLANRFALIILDWNLPPSNGWEILRALREHGVTSAVVVLSGRFREEITADLESMGAAYLSKHNMNSASFAGAIATALYLACSGVPRLAFKL